MIGFPVLWIFNRDIQTGYFRGVSWYFSRGFLEKKLTPNTVWYFGFTPLEEFLRFLEGPVTGGYNYTESFCDRDDNFAETPLENV
jgi:hypothetical protein